MVLMSVDLPLPLGPRMATCSPDSVERLRRFKARRPQRSTEMFLSSNRAGKIKVEGSRRFDRACRSVTYPVRLFLLLSERESLRRDAGGGLSGRPGEWLQAKMWHKL